MRLSDELPCQLKNQPELRIQTQQSPRTMRKSSWEWGHPAANTGLHGSRQLPTQEAPSLGPGPQTLSLGGWTVGMTGVSPILPSSGVRELEEISPQSLRGNPRGLTPRGRGEPGPGASPRETGEATLTHTPHSLTLTHRYAHMHSHAFTHVLTHSPPTQVLPYVPVSLSPGPLPPNCFPTGPSATLQGPEDNALGG